MQQRLYLQSEAGQASCHPCRRYASQESFWFRPARLVRSLSSIFLAALPSRAQIAVGISAATVCSIAGGKADAHPHAALCEFSRRHFGIGGYFSASDVFAKSMAIRLPELAKEYLVTHVTNPDMQQDTYRKCKQLMNESPFFSTVRFKELVHHLIA